MPTTHLSHEEHDSLSDIYTTAATRRVLSKAHVHFVLASTVPKHLFQRRGFAVELTQGGELLRYRQRK